MDEITLSDSETDATNNGQKDNVTTVDELKARFPQLYDILKKDPTKWEPKEIDVIEKSMKICAPVLKRKLNGSNTSPFGRISFIFNGNELISKRFECKKCKKQFHGSGGHLKRHTDDCMTKAAQPGQKTLIGSFTKPLTKPERKKMTHAFGLVALDGSISFKKLESPALRTFARNMFNLGASHGSQLSDDSQFPGRKSIASESISIADDRFDIVKKKVLEAVSLNSVSVAFDYGKNIEDWLAVICHFPTLDGNLHSFPIVFIDWDPKVSKEADEVWNVLVGELDVFGITEFNTTNMAAITDQGGNVKNAARNFGLSVVCLGHILHTTAERSTKLYKTNKLPARPTAVLKEARSVMKQCKALVKFLRVTYIGVNLPIIPQLPVSTRWLTHANMLSDTVRIMPKLQTAYDMDKECFGNKSAEGIAVIKNIEMILVLCKFYSIFESAITSIQAENVPTIQRVLPIFKGFETTAKKLMTEKDPLEDGQGSKFDELRRCLGLSLKTVIEKKENDYLTDVHYLAAMLWPNYKTINRFPLEVRQEAEDLLITLAGTLEVESVPPPAKKQKTMFDFSDQEDDENDPLEVKTAVLRELDNYRAMTQKPDEQCLISWWINQKAALPLISRIAVKILSIPATSASAERVFSKLKTVLTNHRRSLHPSTTSKLIQFSNIDPVLLA